MKYFYKPKALSAMKPKMEKFIDRIEQSAVIVYSDSCAVALSFSPGMDAPEIAAKGKKKKRDLMLELSRQEHGTPVVENSVLANDLYRKTKTGECIPKKKYEVAAQLIANVMTEAERQEFADFQDGRLPTVKLKNLVLSEEILHSLDLALNQYRCRDVMEKWGLNKAFLRGNALTLLFSGPPGVGKTVAAEAIANELGKRILVVDYSKVEGDSTDETGKNIAATFRRAKKSESVLFWDEADAFIYSRDNVHSREARPINVILQELEKFQGVCIFSTNREAELDGALFRRIGLRINFTPPSRDLRRKLWDKMLPPTMPLADDVDFDNLSQSSLTGGDIKNIIINAARGAACRGMDAAVTMADFKVALEQETRNKNRTIGSLNFLAGDVRLPLVQLKNMVLPTDVMTSLDLALNQHRCRNIMEQWGMDKAFPYGNALALLFYGPPGVGKTATAEAIAGELGKNILVVDYSQIESKWSGETEKNIVSAFQKAHERDSVLFWDEADGIMYNRDDAAHSWEIRPINVMLQELEKFEGVCIFSTNREAALDGALSRRISLKIEFKPPSPEILRKLWAKMIPPEMPLADDVDFDILSRYSLTGGDIKNIVCNAARGAAGRGIGAVVTMDDFKLAVKLETKNNDNGVKKIGF